MLDQRVLTLIIMLLVTVLIRTIAIYSNIKSSRVKKRDVIVSMIVFILSNTASLAMSFILEQQSYLQHLTVAVMWFGAVVVTTDMIWAMVAYKRLGKKESNYIKLRPTLSFLWGLTVAYLLYKVIVLV